MTSRRSLLESASQGQGEIPYLAWIVLGLVASFIGSKIVNKKGERILLAILLGIVGAVVGGVVFQHQQRGLTRLNLYSLLLAVIGAVALPAACHAIPPIT